MRPSFLMQEAYSVQVFDKHLTPGLHCSGRGFVGSLKVTFIFIATFIFILKFF